jgi:2-oxoglutarate ferredoxin oxidoreductase subunit beta
MFGLKSDCIFDVPERYFSLNDYEKNVPRWCPGCGDHGILTAIQRLCRENQLPPEKVVNVSGIGCSSRFPHYMNTYGFHGLHGRAFPVACGVKFRRPDLSVFVATGDGDCCSIGTAHWIHAIRYNMDMVVTLLDNGIYGLTKKQTSPTSRTGTVSNTHPRGSVLPPLNPILTTLSVSNVSFVAQTVDWLPSHVYETVKKAYEHPGFSFVRILQRCPLMNKGYFEEMVNDPSAVTVLQHENGVPMDENMARVYKNTLNHDPSNLGAAMELAQRENTIPIGMFYHNPDAYRYDLYGAANLGFTPEQKEKALNEELDRYAV